MKRPAEIGAAVIGSGFIGTVHIEALRRLGVQVHGLLGSSPDRSAKSAQRLGVPKAYASLEDLLAEVLGAVALRRRRARATNGGPGFP